MFPELLPGRPARPNKPNLGEPHRAMPSPPSPEPARRQKESKEKRKKKSKTKNPPVLPEHGRNEGTNPHWAYKPPPDAVLVDHDVDAEEFDWDAVKNDEDLELWLIRVPDGVSEPQHSFSAKMAIETFFFRQVKPKYLENIKINHPSSSKNERLGTLVRKYATYDIWSIGKEDDQPIGGEEIMELSSLLPR